MLVIDQLIEKINQKNSPIVVGLDPRLSSLPDFIKAEALNQHGNTLKAAAEAIYQFNIKLLEEVHSVTPAVKLQMACYELYGAEGLATFDKTVTVAKELGLIVIDDSKRNDIGSTAEMYAEGHLGHPPLIEGNAEGRQEDFLTINPYLGSDTISPFIKTCQANNKGIFLLVRTSNPSAADYQEATIDGKPLYEKIAIDLNLIATKSIGKNGFSPFGAVVGATWPEEAEKLRRLMPASFFLVPGYGAQGGTADQATHSFNDNGYGAIINSSRGIIEAWKKMPYKEEFPDSFDFAKAAKQAALDMRDDLLLSLKQAGKLPNSW